MNTNNNSGGVSGFVNGGGGFMGGGNGAAQPLTEESVLSLLIVLGSSISLVGLVFAFITYSLFSDLRSLSGTTLMNLLAALFMTQLLYVIGVGGVPDPRVCLSLAGGLHYVRLAALCWLLTMAHHMYHHFRDNLNLVSAAEPTLGKKFFRYSAFAWGFPGILLITSLSIQYHDKAGRLSDMRSLGDLNCWFLDDNAHIYGLLVPSVGIVLTTIIYLIRAAIVARLVISMQIDRRTKHKMRRKRTLQIVLFFKITVLLSTVIVLGALTKFIKSDALWIAFNVGQGMQGIFIAMLVTCNCQVLKIYTKTIKSQRRKRQTANGGYFSSSYGNISGPGTEISKSTSLQLLTWDPTPDAV
ncbi:adhesion G protein-coupled receptor E3-like [Chrysoperla carnea]|uniref:adhesion G protein-coupled receptor E3-like n=1 Tax=Chrysoperla carnea TaxID=189513 RepID=UPI001D064B2F|nr:adhesion G protein-coupled receptor E3-like [Chrysoperla carnea]